MKIKKTSNGWYIEPSTSDEDAHIAFLIEAIKATYGLVREGGQRCSLSQSKIS